jgi:hypothetical protein
MYCQLKWQRCGFKSPMDLQDTISSHLHVITIARLTLFPWFLFFCVIFLVTLLASFFLLLRCPVIADSLTGCLRKNSRATVPPSVPWLLGAFSGLVNCCWHSRLTTVGVLQRFRCRGYTLTVALSSYGRLRDISAVPAFWRLWTSDILSRYIQAL